MNATELVWGLSSTPIPITSFINSGMSSEVGFGDIMSSTMAMDIVTTTEAPDVRSWITNLIMQVCTQKNCLNGLCLDVFQLHFFRRLLIKRD